MEISFVNNRNAGRAGKLHGRELGALVGEPTMNAKREDETALKDITLVLAMAENGVIGKNGAIPWRIPDDLKRFKALTLGSTVVMGRKTWDSLPKKPLPGRDNIVMTRDGQWRGDGAVMASSFADAIERTRSKLMVIGGADIYRMALPLAARIELTEVHETFDGDAVFTFDRGGWREIARDDHRTADGLGYSFVTLVR